MRCSPPNSQRRTSAVNEPLRFTAATSDGENLYAIRYASDLRLPTLYLNTRGAWRRRAHRVQADRRREYRDSLPPQSFVRIDRVGAAVSPFRRS